MPISNWNLLFYAVIVVMAVVSLGWSVGCYCYSRKVKKQKESEDWMTKKEFKEQCRKNQEDCPQMEIIDTKLEKIIRLSEKNNTHTRHLSECFLLLLSQTEIDDGVREHIHDKLKQQVDDVFKDI